MYRSLNLVLKFQVRQDMHKLSEMIYYYLIFWNNPIVPNQFVDNG